MGHMNIAWVYAIGSVILVSLVALIGIVALSWNKRFLKKIIFILVSLSVGTMLGGALLHLIPESYEHFGSGLYVSFGVLAGILFFFALEKFIHWRHCHIHTDENHPHPFAIMNLIGDGFHNFMDGIAIGAAYLVSIPVGISTTVAVILHEIPQEISDFGVLIHGGYSHSRALFLNFISASVSILGALLALLIGSRIENFALYVLPLIAGGFIFIAGSDLIPELKDESDAKRSLIQFLTILVGISLMFGVLLLE